MEQHSKNTSPNPAATAAAAASAAAAARSAISVACVACRSRHLKCDGAAPCGRCLSDNQNCIYLKSRRGWKGPRKARTNTQQTGSTVQDAPVSISTSQRPLEAERSASISVGVFEPSPTVSLLPSPPETTSIIPFDGYGQVGRPSRSMPLTPPAITDASEQGLNKAFYTFFHPAHAFVPPRHCLHVLDGWQTSHLELAMRYVGCMYVPAANRSDYEPALQQVLHNPAIPNDGVKVMAMLLFAIGLHMADREELSAEIMRETVALAYELGMNRNDYSIQHGGGQPMLEECWRRTWWEIFVLDGIFTGVNPNQYRLQLGGVFTDVSLPCEEQEFQSGQVPPAKHSLEDYDDEVFQSDDMVFSSQTYRVDAIRLLHKVQNVQMALQMHGNVGEEVVEAADIHLNNWKLHLPPSKRTLVNKSGQVDEVLFTAHMIVYACAIMLHRPRSDLNSDEAKDVTTCISAHQTPLPSAGQDLHTAKALKAAKDISALITLPCPLLQHTPFFTCAVVMASVVFLSYWSFILTPEDDSLIKDHIKLNVGMLKRTGERWAIANTVLNQVRGVAREIFQSRRALMNAYMDGITREDAFHGMIEESIATMGTLDESGNFVFPGNAVFNGDGDVDLSLVGHTTI